MRWTEPGHGGLSHFFVRLHTLMLPPHAVLPSLRGSLWNLLIESSAHGASPALSLRRSQIQALMLLFGQITETCCCNWLLLMEWKGILDVVLRATNKAQEHAYSLCNSVEVVCIELKTTWTAQYNCCLFSLPFGRSTRNTDEQQLNETVINDSALLPFVFDTASAGGQSRVSGEKHSGGKGMTEEC